MTIFILLSHIALSIILLLFINALGKTSIVNYKYTNIADIQKQANLGYNITTRILSPAIYISFLSIIFYAVNLNQFVINIWLISVFFWIENFSILIILNRFSLVNKILYFIIILLSIITAYFIYELALKKGLYFILPEAGNFRTEIWFIIIIYFYSLLNSLKPDPISEQEKEKSFIKTKYEKLQEKYSKFLKDEFKTNKVLRSILFSLMISEDINRPSYIRSAERFLSKLRLAHTTGIMQVKSNRNLSDKESIILAQKKILEKYNEVNKDISTWNIVLKIAKDYNGSKYADDVWATYNIIN